ncbi:iron complex transport system ATP-binding protein [Microbacterium sp. SORGH_AS428]|uniref:heme ABC transporter ATP-binding protein n=1 Tax=Microbacterium sp. SORGH_AS_0428 TaxID=3041788 RepID=UPI00286162B6|nr:heme ABC transporter ATP-binding protein [Microbacterium sp. SORGH_AS_0428]MDR6200099.1 iron complex transport system ATP-binding protein [Microbacterium sp. SORGH_AS_0428]
MSAPAIRLDAVGLRLGGVDILRDISLDIGFGRVVALVGPNGAGKSSLMGIMAGDVRPASGEVLLDGRPIGSLRPSELARMRSVLLQENRVAFAFSAREVVEMGRAPWHGEARGRDDVPISDAMAAADVVHLGERTYTSLSGGEKARVSLARVLAQQTPVVLLDEPTAALDLRHQEDVLRIARGLAAAGRAVVVVLHDLSLAAAYADDVAMVAAGSLAAFGAPAEVVTAERVESVYATPVRILADPDTGRPIVLPRRSS